MNWPNRQLLVACLLVVLSSNRVLAESSHPKHQSAGQNEQQLKYYSTNACGPAALMLAARVAGYRLAWGKILQQTEFKGEPVSLATLSRAARSFGIPVTAWKCDVGGLGQFGGPGILDYPRGHFSVFLGWSKTGRARIGDWPPAIREVDPDVFQESWGGHLLLIKQETRK